MCCLSFSKITESPATPTPLPTFSQAHWPGISGYCHPQSFLNKYSRSVVLVCGLSCGVRHCDCQPHPKSSCQSQSASNGVCLCPRWGSAGVGQVPAAQALSSGSWSPAMEDQSYLGVRGMPAEMLVPWQSRTQELHSQGPKPDLDQGLF